MIPALDEPARGGTPGAGPSPTREPRRVALWSAAGLVLLASLLCAHHAQWFFSERPGLTIEVDEGAYLGGAVQVTNRALEHRLGAVASYYFEEQQQHAPLLSLVTVPFLVVGSIGLQWALVAQLPVLVLLMLATFLLARRLVGDPWSVLAAAVVGCAPSFVDYTRTYHFGLLSAATMTAAVWCLVASEGFTRRWPSVGWGIFVGLALLSRTMMVSFAPGLVVAGALAAVAVPTGRRRRIAYFGAGLACATVVALPWWVANWRAVSTYLKGFGYGGSGNAYGPLYSPTEPLYWLRIPYRMAQELYLPLALLLLVGVASAGWFAVRSARRSGVRAFIIGAIESGHLLVVVVLGSGMGALMSSRNKGTGFILPLLPMVVVLAVSGVSRMRLTSVRRALVALLCLTLAVDVAMKSGTVGSLADARMASFSVSEWPIPITDGRSHLDAYLEPTGYPSDFDALSPTVDTIDCMVEHTRSPDVPVAVVADGETLVNGTYMALVQQIHRDPISVLTVHQTATNSVESYAQQLTDFTAEFLVTLDLEPFPASFSGAVDEVALVKAGRALGFEPVCRLPLIGDRVVRVWQREVPPSP